MGQERCYKCDAIATGREHVPPLCIFPEVKDLGEDYRKNLITVPSCDDHNLKKTKDDEFFMASITGNIGNNIIGYRQTKTKVRRALDRKYVGFINTIMKDAEEMNIKTKKGIVFPVLAGSPDIDRIRRCIDHISCGIYYHEYGKAFEGEIRVVYDFLKYEDNNINKLKTYFKDIYASESVNFPLKGNNPKIFHYQIVPPNIFGIIGLKLTFFEGTIFFVALQLENNPEPFDLGYMMIQDGIKSTIRHNGKDYEFN